MKVQILDSKSIDNKNWYLCKCNLYEYLKELREDFYEYAVQRRIVKNTYLDTLYNTIKVGDPIPPITLTCSHITPDKSNATIEVADVEILDGLQRTFRLWAYKSISEIYEGEHPRDFAKKVKELKPIFFDSGVITAGAISRLVDSGEIKDINNIFSQYELHLVIWTGMNDKQIVEKMLYLNAGQKAVSTTHQYELLFLHFLPNLNAQNVLTLIREKDANANNVKRGNREVGHVMFTSFIVGLESLIAKKPKRIDPEALNIADTYTEYESDIELSTSLFEMVFSKKFLEVYLKLFKSLDELIFTQEEGKEWFAKDTSISGVLAAIGKYIDIRGELNIDDIIDRTQNGFRILIDKIEKNGLNLKEFTSEYNILSSRSVNIGNFIRYAVMIYVIDMIEDKSPTWQKVFESVKSGRKS